MKLTPDSMELMDSANIPVSLSNIIVRGLIRTWAKCLSQSNMSAGVSTADVHTNGNRNPCLTLQLQRSPEKGRTLNVLTLLSLDF